jgi:AcrR family transcriptional regulator
MRADAKKNYDRLLEVAREAFAEHGPEASMRDIARRAEVGFATLLRHFPTREAFVEALLCDDLDALPRRAEELERTLPPAEALATWFREWMGFARTHRGVVALLASVHDEPQSALYASCASVHAASARLLARAQADGEAREDMNGDDMFGLMAALGWLIDLPSFAPRAEHLARLVSSAILPDRQAPGA